jgi:hypothetical protein
MMSLAIPHTLLMIRPLFFGFNDQTASSNSFQSDQAADKNDIQREALKEFDRMAELLLSHNISLKVFDDNHAGIKPDALFPNNWISLHPDGTVVLYPMLAENRRLERRNDIIEQLKKDFQISSTIDLSSEEKNGNFLEGTGSIIYDHVNKNMFACLSPRTNEELLKRFAKRIGYNVVSFHAVNEKSIAVYHTNVMMSLGKEFAVVCLDSIRSDAEQEIILETLNNSSHKIIAISHAQMNQFAGNIFEVKCGENESVVLMSKRAFNSMLPGQLRTIEKFAEILQIEIPTIEAYGGGSVRCMVAGIYLPTHNSI